MQVTKGFFVEIMYILLIFFSVGTEYASSKGAKDRSRSRQEPVHDDHQHPPGLRLRVSHQRSHQRSRSAHDGPSMGHHVERKISTFTNEIAKPLQIQFQVWRICLKSI